MLELAFFLAVSDFPKLAIGDHCRVFSSSSMFLRTSLAEADYPTHFQSEVVIAGFRGKKLSTEGI
jgi:hypothetical protein